MDYSQRIRQILSMRKRINLARLLLERIGAPAIVAELDRIHGRETAQGLRGLAERIRLVSRRPDSAAQVAAGLLEEAAERSAGAT